MASISQYAPRTGQLLRADSSELNEADWMAKSPLGIARGLVTGAANLSSYGELTTAGAVTDHLVWPLAGTGTLAVPASPGVQMTISSSSTDDDSAGTGIRTIRILYLDADLAAASEDITMDGTTGVTTVATDIRFIQCMFMLTAGSGGKAAGNISAVHSGTTYSYIATGKRRCSSSARRVPAGKRLIVQALYASSASGTATARSEIRMVTTGIDILDTTESAITYPHVAVGLQDCSEAISNLSFVVPAGIVIAFEVTTDKAATISAGFHGWLEPV